MPSKNSKIITARLHESDVNKLKASGHTASQILKEYLNKGNTPTNELPDLTEFLRVCERRKRRPQEIIDMVTEQLLSN